MLYRKLGKTDTDISAFSFGTMRWLSEESCYRAVQRGIDAGMNYLDTSTSYVNGMSEVWTGRAVKNRRSEVLVSSKSQYGRAPNETAVRKAIENSLIRSELDYFEYYQLWGLSTMGTLQEALKRGGFIDGVHRAMADGLIKKGVGFTFHGTADVFRAAVDSGVFLCATVSYNSANRAEEGNIKYAADRGVGIFIMNPLGGGVLAKEGANAKSGGWQGALRFLLGNCGITSALLGACGPEQIERDVILMGELEKSRGNSAERNSGQPGIHLKRGEASEASSFCTGCRYCEVCENGFSPSRLMQALRDARLGNIPPEDFDQWLRINYLNGLTPDEALENCVECGKCQLKCPQKLGIVDEIRRVKGSAL